MTLGKRSALLIFPVLLVSYLLVALAVYYVERSSIERREQARLSNNLTELRATFSVYASFVDSYLFAIVESEALHQYLLEQQDRYREHALGSRLEAALGNLTRRRSDYLSFSLIEADGTPAFFFVSSDNPFRELSAEEQAVARSAWQSGALSGIELIETADGTPMLVQYKLIDRRTFSTPLPTQRDHSVLAQIAIELNAFEAQLDEIIATYDAAIDYGASARPVADDFSGEIRLLPGHYLRIQPSPRYIEQRLDVMQQGLLIGALVFALSCALLLMWLMRRYVTDPVSRLEQQLNDLMHGQRTALETGTGDEIGRLALRFQQLYDQLNDAYRRSRQLAEHDPLTGLPNRNHFYEMAVRELKLASDNGRRVALLYIDLDHFKFVNDKYGHSVGDALLKSFAQRAGSLLQQECDRSPGAGQGVLARLAGDEFAVLLYRFVEPDHPQQLASRLLGLVRGGYQFEMGRYPVTLSIGIARYPEDGHTITQLISNADTAMYQAKHGGKNQVAFYSQKLARQARWALEIEHQLKAINFDDELFLTYMPVLDAQGRVEGCEALLRWHSPVLGAVGPDQFIPIAERTGLYSRIDRWVVQQALSDYETLSRLLGDDMTLAINVSSAELTVTDFDQFMQEQLERSAVPAHRIEVEMTETFGVDASRQRDRLLRQLRALGLRIAIDDFGTGYTSMMQMLEYPVDKLKLDRSFVERLMEPSNRALLKPVIALAHARGLQVTAEGVETREQADSLIAAGCDLLQGYLFGKPMRLSELELWARKRAAQSTAPNLEQPV
jgi:diguanylate cyclase (GGDEF)-like protein